MRMKNNKSGFTLLEIIIVIIIVGVLASLALPRLFNTIEFSRSTEALNILGGLKRGADRCALANEATTGAPNWATCVTFAQLGTEDPGLVPGAAYSYAVTFGAPAAADWRAVATRENAGGSADQDTITFTYDTAGGGITRVGTGAYATLK